MWARIENGTVAELTDVDPDGRFHPSLAWISYAGIVPPPQIGWTATEANGIWTMSPPADRSAEITRAVLVSAAQTALDKSDVTAIRCWKAGVPFPAEWQSYCTSLRSIVSGSLSVMTLPTQPAYPPAT